MRELGLVERNTCSEWTKSGEQMAKWASVRNSWKRFVGGNGLIAQAGLGESALEIIYAQGLLTIRIVSSLLLDHS